MIEFFFLFVLVMGFAFLRLDGKTLDKCTVLIFSGFSFLSLLFSCGQCKCLQLCTGCFGMLRL